MRISDWSSDVCSSDLTAAMHFDGVRVPAENLIGPENGGFIGIMRNFNSERLGMAMGCCAYARVAMAQAAEWARNRETFGKPLFGNQSIRIKPADKTGRAHVGTPVTKANLVGRLLRAKKTKQD